MNKSIQNGVSSKGTMSVPALGTDDSSDASHGDTLCLTKLPVAVVSTENGHSNEIPSFCSNVDRRNRKGLVPLFFERATGNFLNPCFDAKMLENEFQSLSVTVDKGRFQTALLYLACACLILSIFFAVSHVETKSHVTMSVGCACGCFTAVVLFLVTKFVRKYSEPCVARILSICVSIFYCAAEVLSFFATTENDFSFSARFGVAMCMITVIYTMMPALPLYGNMIIAIMYSIAHELVASFSVEKSRSAYKIISISVLHLCIHILGITIVFMAQIRKRSTFWRVGQSIVAKQDLDIEQRVKNRMIRSVMPKKVAEFLIENSLKHKRVDLTDKLEKPFFNAFRPFTMYKIENVSILFADIVGFTNMSADKKADDLVYLLNLLFGKFDELTEINNCEKISTLGDCYYCVAGCPEESEHHAISCVEMGLDIVEEIKKFCEKTGENVDMRVGIHTGSVLCGIVGNRRRRFDVWSNDVQVANQMESKGKPGMVHLTEATLAFLPDQYQLDEGAGIESPNGLLKSYFIANRKNELTSYKPWHISGDGDKLPIYPLYKGKDHTDSIGSVIEGLDPETKKKLSDAAKKSKSNLNLEDIDIGYSKDQVKSLSKESIEKDFSSQCSIPSTNAVGNLQKALTKTPLPYPRLGKSFNFTYGMTLNEALMRDAMRASNDNQLVRLMRGKKIQKEYFFNPPLHLWSLTFKDEEKSDKNKKEIEMNVYKKKNRKKAENITEKKYRDEGFKGFKLNPKITTFASPKVHFLFDVVTNAFTLLGMVVSSILFYYERFSISFMVLTPVCVLAMLSILIFQCWKISPKKCPLEISHCSNQKGMSESGSITGKSCMQMDEIRKGSADVNYRRTFKKRMFSTWVCSHLCGSVIMCLPVLVIFSTYQDCIESKWQKYEIEFFSMLMFVGLLHFCSFTQLSSLMKTGLAYTWSLAFILMLVLSPATNCMLRPEKMDSLMIRDVVVVVVLQIALITVLNRIHEQGVRANFYGDMEAAEQKNIAIEQKQVADWLISDMFPRHVSEQLKYTNHCSKHYDMVGVLFATIVNFSGFYEENFEGGLECIRILHELVADFDNELNKFDDIEKIKTVYGTTFMAASGLDQKDSEVAFLGESSAGKYIHLKALVDFAIAMRKSLDDFNDNMLEFRFQLRCGFNAGPVTAGVIGTMKPQYDIWGDTVNLASRMDSTGVVDRIQVSENCMKKLDHFYDFEERGTIFVKGKGLITTYLLVGPKKTS